MGFMRSIRQERVSLASVLERNIQVELYRVLQNRINKKFSFNDVEFVGVRFEPA